MASQRYSNIEVKVGLFLAFCLGLFILMLVSYGRFAPVWRGRMDVYVAFENVTSLRADAPVRYNGLEVGRVKWLRTLHLDDDNLERLPALTKRDLENLPLRPEALLKQLREADDADFEQVCRTALKNRTMIELCLEVLQEGDVKRYRMDDQVRIVSTVFGDAAVEIISGGGAINTGAGNQLLLGTTGDFFSNLAKSMGEVKDILSSVTDVVGTRERRSFVRAQGRLASINAKLDDITALANRRANITARRVDKLGDDIPATMNKAAKMLEDLRPQSQRTADNVKAGLKEMQDRVNAAQTEASKAWDDVAADAKGVREDVKGVWDKSKPDYDQMRKVGKEVYDKVGGLSRRVDGFRDTAGRLMSQNEPEVARMRQAFKNGLVNLDQFGQTANENKDLMISEKDKGEHLYNTAVCIYRGLCITVRRVGQAGSETEETCTLLATNPEAAALLARARATVTRLDGLRNKLAGVRDAVEERALPDFERKKTGWTDTPPAKP